MEDGIISVDKITEAQDLVEQATEVCRTGSLRLHKFTSNKALLKTIPKSEQAMHADVQLMQSETEQTLGIQWDTAKDLLRFKLDLTTKDLTRSLLSVLSTVFGLLGLIAPSSRENSCYRSVAKIR